MGDSPDERSAMTCKRHGVPVNHAAQQISSSDFADFDYVIGMDQSNLSRLKQLQPKGNRAVVKLFGDWRTDNSYSKIVEDPYYGGSSGFERNFNQIVHFSEEFLKQEVGTL